MTSFERLDFPEICKINGSGLSYQPWWTSFSGIAGKFQEHGEFGPALQPSTLGHHHRPRTARGFVVRSTPSSATQIEKKRVPFKYGRKKAFFTESSVLLASSPDQGADLMRLLQRLKCIFLRLAPAQRMACLLTWPVNSTQFSIEGQRKPFA
jgi:hypothetical protein